MKKGNEASTSIILAGRALLVKMLITLEPCYAFGSNFEYFFFSFFILFFSFLFLFIIFFNFLFLFFYCFFLFFLFSSLF